MLTGMVQNFCHCMVPSNCELRKPTLVCRVAAYGARASHQQQKDCWPFPCLESLFLGLNYIWIDLISSHGSQMGGAWFSLGPGVSVYVQL
jgi:hypothetical protein